MPIRAMVSKYQIVDTLYIYNKPVQFKFYTEKEKTREIERISEESVVTQKLYLHGNTS